MPDIEGGEVQADWWPKSCGKTAAFEGTPATMLNLPIEETPEIAWGAPANWAVVNPKRLDADFDDSVPSRRPSTGRRRTGIPRCSSPAK